MNPCHVSGGLLVRAATLSVGPSLSFVRESKGSCVFASDPLSGSRYPQRVVQVTRLLSSHAASFLLGTWGIPGIQVSHRKTKCTASRSFGRRFDVFCFVLCTRQLVPVRQEGSTHRWRHTTRSHRQSSRAALLQSQRLQDEVFHSSAPRLS